MTHEELRQLNIGENLDSLMNLDPRGYGVCRILYSAARAYTKEPLSMNAAKQLVKNIKENDVVFIITGFVLLPFKEAEMDGIISSMLLARSLVVAFNAKPIIICPKESIKAVKSLSYVVGLHLFENLDYAMEFPVSMGAFEFSKDVDEANAQTDMLIDKYKPKAVISIEAPGANFKGEYHNATGLNVTELEAKADILFNRLRDKGVLNIAIGDLGNEIGMGTIGEHIRKHVPYTDENCCKCSCHGGTLATSKSDNIITATVSDWGAYAMMAALAYLMNNIEIFHTADMENDALQTAAKSGMIDMSGWLIPAIDGISAKMTVSIVELMRKSAKCPYKHKENSSHWFDNVLELGFYKNGE